MFSDLQELLHYLKESSLSVTVGNYLLEAVVCQHLSAEPFNEKAGKINNDNLGRIQSYHMNFSIYKHQGISK